MYSFVMFESSPVFVRAGAGSGERSSDAWTPARRAAAKERGIGDAKADHLVKRLSAFALTCSHEPIRNREPGLTVHNVGHDSTRKCVVVHLALLLDHFTCIMTDSRHQLDVMTSSHTPCDGFGCTQNGERLMKEHDSSV